MYVHGMYIHHVSFTAQPVYLEAAMQNYIQKICDCTNFTVNASLLNCIDSSRAIYTIELIGPIADDLLVQLWPNYEIRNSQGIDVDEATISLCNNSCSSYVQIASKSKDTIIPVHLIITIIIVFIIFM